MNAAYTTVPLWEPSLLAMRPAAIHINRQAKKTGATEVAPVVVPVAARIFVGPCNHR